jgi:hypothetical protein
MVAVPGTDPGSPRPQDDGSDDGSDVDDEILVWYAAYGSNLSTERFHCYLRGGRPLGATRDYEPCPAGQDFLDSRPVLLDRRLRFARRSPTWDGGGVAFVEHQPTPDHRTYARAYLLSVAQLRHVIRQENRLAEPIPPLLAATVCGSEAIRLGVPATRFYTHLLPFPSFDGRPVLTLTGGRDPLELNPPSPAYRRTVVKGLRETWPELDDEDIERYLTDAGAPVGQP